MICEMNGILTPAEKQLLKLDDGEEQIRKLRGNLFSVSRQKYYEIIEKVIGIKIIEFIFKVSAKYDAGYSLVIFQENIEKRFENLETRGASKKFPKLNKENIIQ